LYFTLTSIQCGRNRGAYHPEVPVLTSVMNNPTMAGNNDPVAEPVAVDPPSLVVNSTTPANGTTVGNSTTGQNIDPFTGPAAVDPPTIVVANPAADDAVAKVVETKKRRNTCCDAKSLQAFSIVGIVLFVGLLFATPFIVRSVSNDKNNAYPITSADDYGPVIVKTLQAIRYTSSPVGEKSGLGEKEVVVPWGDSSVFVRRDTLNSLYVSFPNKPISGSIDSWGTNTAPVPFLNNYIYTAQAPAELVTEFTKLTGSGVNNITGPLTKAITKVMGGESILWVTCTGEGPLGGGAAILCGVSSALYFPATSVDVITFNTPWTGFNPQFAWAFDRFISLYYLWPFSMSEVPAPPQNVTSFNLTEVRDLCEWLKTRVTEGETLQKAVTIPNLPPQTPENGQALAPENIKLPNGTYEETTAACYASYNGKSVYGDTPVCNAGSPQIIDWSPWAPVSSVPAPGQLPPQSDCPPIVCRSRQYINMSCVGFGDASGSNTAYGDGPSAAMLGLPYVTLEHPRSGGDAIVAWNDTSKEAIILFKYTNESRDWVADALAYKIDDFRKFLDRRFPPTEDINDQIGNIQNHAGFYRQFKTLVDGSDKEGEEVMSLEAALASLNGGQDPNFVSISGFSLGGAVSEYGGVWAAHRWPRAHLFIATQGAPKTGNDKFAILFKASVGNVYRFIFNLDEVPAVPPLPGYVYTRQVSYIF
jgi:hypothetical protein